MTDLPSNAVTPEAANIAAKPLWSKRAGWLIEVIAIAFWLYAICKVFVFDIDIWIITHIDGSFVWFLGYKLPIILLVVVIAMLTTRSLSLGMAVLYIALYPLVVLAWKAPAFVWKQKSWLLAFSLLNAGIGFFRSFKRNFIFLTLFLICALIILGFGARYPLIVASVTLLLLLVVIYGNAVIKAFKPSAIFQAYMKVFPALRKTGYRAMRSPCRDVSVEHLTTEQLVARTNNLQTAVLYNRTCLFVSKRLRDYQKSRINTVTYIVSLVGLLIFTVFSFALINYAAFKIDPSLYRLTYGAHTFFAFLYFSAGSMFYATNGIAPLAAVSQLIQLTQFLFAVMLFVILVVVIFTIRNERYTTELSEVIRMVEGEGRIMEDTIRAEYSLSSIEDAIDALQKAKAGMMGVILFMTRSLDEDRT